MKYCSQCGFQNDEEARFCNNCGQEIITSPPARTQADIVKGSHAWLITIAIFVVAIGATIWHFKTSGIWFTEESDKTKAVTTLIPKTPPPRKQKPKPGIPSFSETEIPSGIQKKASKVADTLFGSDQYVGTLQGKTIKFKQGAKDVEQSSNYHYKEQDCNNLFTDVIQQAGHSIQGELAKVTKISMKEENKLGKKLAKQVEKEFEGKLNVDKNQLAYIKTLGKQVVKRIKRKGMDYHFHIISDKKENAFAIPGGGIYVFTGILDKIENEAQLVAILAHEIKHVDLRHCIAIYQVLKKLLGAMQNPIVFIAAKIIKHPYNARTEAEADRRGLELTYSFGYSPYQAVDFWERFDDEKEPVMDDQQGGLFGQVLGRFIEEVENITSSHPKHQKRVCLFKNHIIKLQKKYPKNLVYIGKWNLENNATMYEKQL